MAMSNVDPRRNAIAAPGRRSLFRTALALLAVPVLARTRAFAADAAYPDHAIRMLFGYPPGGGADVIARLCAESLREGLHQPVVVENRAGATGNIAAQAAARAPADGYTIFFGTAAEIAINKQVMKDMGFDPDTDFTPVVLGFNVPLALVVSTKSGYKTFADLIDAARARPGTINFASSGSGTPGHLAGEILAKRTKTRMTHIPYKGGGPALTDVIGGHVDFYFAALNSVLPHVKAGTLRVLALSSAKRSSLVPELPTVAELAVPGFDFTIWGGVFVPAKTPADIVATLNRVVNDAYRKPEIKAKLNAELSEAVANTPEEFAAFVKAEARKYAEVVKEVGYHGQ
jgi:tripartite-type tricarboxylate transporter receptor subunit TctC